MIKCQGTQQTLVFATRRTGELTPWANPFLGMAQALLPLPSYPPFFLFPPSFFSQGSRAIIFDLSFVLKWEGTLVDASGEVSGVGDGDVIVTDLDQDSFSLVASAGGKRCKLEVPVKLRAAEDGGAKDDALARLFSKHGLPLLKARLAEFCSDMLSYEG